MNLELVGELQIYLCVYLIYRQDFNPPTCPFQISSNCMKTMLKIQPCARELAYVQWSVFDSQHPKEKKHKSTKQLSKKKKKKSVTWGLERWLSCQEHSLLFQRAQVQIPASIWQLTSVCNSQDLTFTQRYIQAKHRCT